jgi:uncharacterized protein YybS (DUF2232 family)
MQAGPVKTPSRSPLVSVGKAAAATIIMGMCLAILPVVPALIIPVLALPLAYVVACRGVKYGAIVAVISAALIYVGAGAPTAVLVLLFVVGIGMVLGLALARGWRFERAFAATAFGAFAAMVVWGVILWLAFGVDLTWLKEAAYGAIDNTAAQYAQLGMSADSAGAVSDQMRRLVDVMPYVTPGLLVMAAILLSCCSIGLAYLIFPRLREKLPVVLSLSGFRMHWGAAYGSIAGLAMLLFARGDGDWTTLVMYVGINVLLVSQTLFFVQGVAVARWFAVKHRKGQGAWVALLIAAVLGQMLFQLTGLVGLFDTWVNYRKRYAQKSPRAGSAGGHS